MITIICKQLFFLLVFLLTSFSLFSQEQEITQEKGVILQRKDSSSTTFLKENKRIKVKLLNGKVHVGKFIIANDSTISIRNNEISLDSIAKIKRRSVFNTIITPIIIYYGVSFTGIGILLIATQTYAEVGVIFSAIGIPMLIGPLTSESHRPSKWNYSIGSKPIKRKPIRVKH